MNFYMNKPQTIAFSIVTGVTERIFLMWEIKF